MDIGNANLGAVGRTWGTEAALHGRGFPVLLDGSGLVPVNLPAHLSPVALQGFERVFRRITCPRATEVGEVHAAWVPGVSEVGCTRTCLGITLEIPEEGCGPPSLEMIRVCWQ